MRIFQEVVLPDTCYVDEVPFWIALARIPDFITNEDGWDSRNDREAAFSGERVGFFPTGFNELEFRMLGIDVDIDRYEEALARAGNLTGAEYMEEEKARWAGEEPSDAMAFLLEDSRKIAAADIDWARDIETKLVSVLDRARADVFSALSSGRIRAIGWLKQPNPDPDGELGRFVDIPATAWNWQFDWQDGTLKSRGSEYNIAQVLIEDMLRIFPRPLATATPVAVSLFADTILWDEANDASLHRPVKAPRGRPLKPAPSQRTIIHNFFKHKITVGVKREALCHEVMEFAEKAFNEKIGRTTAQEYIDALLPPEIDAGN